MHLIYSSAQWSLFLQNRYNFFLGGTDVDDPTVALVVGKLGRKVDGERIL